MFRRDVLLSVGGYSTELIDHGWFGWEDYDMWLKLAAGEHECRQVPRILASYRVHAGSMIELTNLSTEKLSIYLNKKFRHLGALYSDSEKLFGFPSPRPVVPAEADGTDELSHL